MIDSVKFWMARLVADAVWTLGILLLIAAAFGAIYAADALKRWRQRRRARRLGATPIDERRPKVNYSGRKW